MLLHKEGRGPLIGFAITLIGLNAFIALFAGGTFSYIFLAISILPLPAGIRLHERL